MKEITILSGKGGTGKTSITSALASLATNVVFCDNDVDAADLHLIFQPEILESYQFNSGWKAKINTDICNSCGLCAEHCRFNAIHYTDETKYKINPYQCEGCRLCERLCPTNAIASLQNKNNFWYVSNSRFGPFVHAQMGPGEENSGKLVTQVRKKAKELAIEHKAAYIINDGPPGIGCATISSLSGTNLVIIVVEPSKSGLHDLQRLTELIQSFKIDAFAIINKYDINPKISMEIKKFVEDNKTPLLAEIPFDKEMVEAMIAGKSIVEFNKKSIITERIKTVWEIIKN